MAALQIKKIRTRIHFWSVVIKLINQLLTCFPRCKTRGVKFQFLQQTPTKNYLNSFLKNLNHQPLRHSTVKKWHSRIEGYNQYEESINQNTLIWETIFWKIYVYDMIISALQSMQITNFRPPKIHATQHIQQKLNTWKKN